MPDPLPLSVRAFMIRTGRTTAAEADAKGMGVLDDLAVMDAVAIYCMCKSAEKRDNLTVQKAALLVANTEMRNNNLSIENWKERGLIAASTTWPADQASIDALIALLDSDPAPPGPNPDDPPTQQTASEQAIKDSRDRNKEIRDKLNDAAAAGGTEPFPTNVKLAQAFGAWLERHGVDESPDSVLVSFDGIQYTPKSSFMTPFVTPSTPALAALWDGGTKYWMGKEFGSDPLVLELAQGTNAVGSFDLDQLHSVIDTQLWPGTGIQSGWIYQNGDHYFAVAAPYTSPQLMSDGNGGFPGKTVDGQIYWSNGTKFYNFDPSIATIPSMRDFIEKDGGDQAILSGIKDGTPYLGFTAPGGPWTEVQPKDSYISNPSPAERGAWAIHFDDQIDKFQANNNLWSAQSGAQQVRMQDDVAQYASLLGVSSNMTQNNGRMLERLLPGR